MVNKQRMPIRAEGLHNMFRLRAEGPHVGTDPVSVRLRDNSVYRPHNIFRLRAEGPHVGTDPVSVRLRANSVYQPHNIFRPVVPVRTDTGSVPTCGRSARVGVY